MVIIRQLGIHRTTEYVKQAGQGNPHLEDLMSYDNNGDIVTKADGQ